MSRRERGNRTYKWGRVKQINPMVPQLPDAQELLRFTSLSPKQQKRFRKRLRKVTRGLLIVKPSQGIRTDIANEYIVDSETKKDVSYKVYWNYDCSTSVCECLDWKWDQECKHVRAVMRWRRKSIAIAPAHDYLNNTYSDALDDAADELEFVHGEQLASAYGDITDQGLVRDPLKEGGTSLQ